MKKHTIHRCSFQRLYPSSSPSVSTANMRAHTSVPSRNKIHEILHKKPIMRSIHSHTEESQGSDEILHKKPIMRSIHSHTEESQGSDEILHKKPIMRSIHSRTAESQGSAETSQYTARTERDTSSSYVNISKGKHKKYVETEREETSSSTRKQKMIVGKKRVLGELPVNVPLADESRQSRRRMSSKSPGTKTGSATAVDAERSEEFSTVSATQSSATVDTEELQRFMIALRRIICSAIKRTPHSAGKKPLTEVTVIIPSVDFAKAAFGDYGTFSLAYTGETKVVIESHASIASWLGMKEYGGRIHPVLYEGLSATSSSGGELPRVYAWAKFIRMEATITEKKLKMKFRTYLSNTGIPACYGTGEDMHDDA